MGKNIQFANLSSGDVLPFSLEGDSFMDQNVDVEELEKSINLNYTTVTYKVYVLFPDETINYEIPSDKIKAGGSYSENYQNGQRRSLTFTLYNETGEYTPGINNFWTGTRLRLDVCLEYLGNKIEFVKGYFVVNKAAPSLTVGLKEVVITAGDKFSWFDNSSGRLTDTYEIPEGNDIEEIIKSILLTEMGNGDVFDTKDILISEELKGKKTQVSIVKNAGETYGDILLELATQMSAEIFYNSNGNLTLVPTVDVSDDKEKPLLYFFDADKGDIGQLSFDYDYNSIVNRVVVLGNSKNGSVYKAVAVNNDTRSPLCYQRIGYRTGTIINDSNIYSDLLASERAEYELRQKLILKTTSSSPILFNPFLSVNNLIAISSEFYNLIKEKFLLQSISFSLDMEGQMTISFSNILNLSSNIEVGRDALLKRPNEI